jgi:hypothetical protein
MRVAGRSGERLAAAVLIGRVGGGYSDLLIGAEGHPEHQCDQWELDQPEQHYQGQ